MRCADAPLVVFAIYVSSGISGGHINPAVSVHGCATCRSSLTAEAGHHLARAFPWLQLEEGPRLHLRAASRRLHCGCYPLRYARSLTMCFCSSTHTFVGCRRLLRSSARPARRLRLRSHNRSLGSPAELGRYFLQRICRRSSAVGRYRSVLRHGQQRDNPRSHASAPRSGHGWAGFSLWLPNVRL